MRDMVKTRVQRSFIIATALVIAISTFALGSSPTAQAAGGPIDLKPWKLTLPVNSSNKPGGKAHEIIGKDLTTYTNSPYYVPTKKDGNVVSVKFYAFDTGATTSSSGNPRSELREMQPGDPSKENNWSPYTGVHRMIIRQKVTQLTGRKHVVVGQIHDKNSKKIDDYTVFRLEGNQLFTYIDGKKSSSRPAIGTVSLGQVFTVGFIVENGKIKMYYSPDGTMANLKLVKTVSYPSGSDGGAYFKAGSYCQCGVGKGYKGSSTVEILGLGVNHSGTNWPDISGTPPGDPIPAKISLADCNKHNRKVTTTDGKQYCASREEEKVVAGAAECVAVKPDHAEYSYIPNKGKRVDDYCGYW